MKKYFSFTKKDFFIFSLAGALFFSANFFIMTKWISFWALILGRPDLGFNSQPTLLKNIQSFLPYFPFGAMAFIFLVDAFRRNFSRLISFVFGSALAFVFLFGFLVFRPIAVDFFHRTRFDSTSWKNEKMASWNNPIRLRMVDDLLKEYKLVGMSREQIDELLGVPEPTGLFQSYDYVYWLGPERGIISIDSESLCIKFNNDIVIEAKILRD